MAETTFVRLSAMHKLQIQVGVRMDGGQSGRWL